MYWLTRVALVARSRSGGRASLGSRCAARRPESSLPARRDRLVLALALGAGALLLGLALHYRPAPTSPHWARPKPLALLLGLGAWPVCGPRAGARVGVF